MPTAVGCPNCGTRLKVGSRHVGKLVDCPKCRTLFVYHGGGEEAPADAMGAEQAGLRSVDWAAAEAVGLPPSANLPPSTVSQTAATLPVATLAPQRGASPAPPLPPGAAPSSSPSIAWSTPVARPSQSPPPMPPSATSPSQSVSGAAATLPVAALAPAAQPQSPSPWSSSAGQATTAMLPPGFAGAPTPAPSVTQSANVPRFKAADPTKSTVQLVVDGKLPELNLLEVEKKTTKTAAEPTKSKSGLLYGALGLSVLLSMSLMLVDLTPAPEVGFDKQKAHRIILNHCEKEGKEPLLPYQVILRDAQRARARGDRATETALYRRVLEMLRMEGRATKSLTASRALDKQLEEAISVELKSFW